MKVIDESNVGTTLFQLVETEQGSLQIQLYSSLSKKWNRHGKDANRAGAEERWAKLKTFNETVTARIAERAKPVKPKRKPKVASKVLTSTKPKAKLKAAPKPKAKPKKKDS